MQGPSSVIPVPSVTIRRCRADDLPSILDVNMSAFAPIHAAFARILGEYIFRLAWPDWRASNTAYIRSLVEGPEAERLYVAEVDGRIVGFVHFTTDASRKRGELGLNAVHPDEQGKGYGKRLHLFAIAAMKDCGVELIQVSTGGDDAHAGARRCYERCGFKPFPTMSYSMRV